MTDIVPTEDIERIVGAKRHQIHHIVRAVSAEQRVYILHSQNCLDSGDPLTECPASTALDRKGIDKVWWNGFEDRPMIVGVWNSVLIPVMSVPDATTQKET